MLGLPQDPQASGATPRPIGCAGPGLARRPPGARARYSALKVKCSTSRSSPRPLQGHSPELPTRITRIQITIMAPPPDRPAARPRSRKGQPPGPRQPRPDTRRDQVTRLMAGEARDATGPDATSLTCSASSPVTCSPSSPNGPAWGSSAKTGPWPVRAPRPGQRHGRCRTVTQNRPKAVDPRRPGLTTRHWLRGALRAPCDPAARSQEQAAIKGKGADPATPQTGATITADRALHLAGVRSAVDTTEPARPARIRPCHADSGGRALTCVAPVKWRPHTAETRIECLWSPGDAGKAAGAECAAAAVGRSKSRPSW